MPEPYQIIFGVVLAVGGIIYFASIGRRLRKADESRSVNSTEPQSGAASTILSERVPTAGEWLGLLFKAIFVLGFASILLAGIGVAGLQAFVWLRSGEWPPLSVIDGLRIIIDARWLTAPTDWIVLHRVLGSLPLSLVLCGIGIGLLFLIFSDD